MKPKKEKKEVLKPVDILLKICLKELFENEVSSSKIYSELEKEITNPNTRYRAKKRIKSLIDSIKKENTNEDLRRYF